ncbi:putative reverse transcriptase domain, reverse transcriptase zinc-binding domain protein, partial [Tanacetum coccineum]
MASTRASISKVSKRPKINIIPPKQLFVDLTQDDTKTPSPKLPNSSPSAPNAPSKTPSTKDTSSSSIDYIPKSPTSSTSPSPNGYLNPSTSPPPRVSPPPPTQDNASMDITLTLSPNTPLDVQFDTPSPSPPIIAHPIPWNFLEAHGNSCLCCRRGLRQGDPISPYLFTLVMEVLNLIIQRKVRLSDSFCYHNHCEELQIINVCFADDLFIFARGEVESARLIIDSLDEFKRTSGLVPSIPKSTAYFCNVRNHIKIAILSIIPFFEGELPIKYLGVPLISSRLLNKDCKILVEKAKNRIGDWKNKSLSFAGRLQL